MAIHRNLLTALVVVCCTSFLAEACLLSALRDRRKNCNDDSNGATLTTKTEAPRGNQLLADSASSQLSLLSGQQSPLKLGASAIGQLLSGARRDPLIKVGSSQGNQLLGSILSQGSLLDGLSQNTLLSALNAPLDRQILLSENNPVSKLTDLINSNLQNTQIISDSNQGAFSNLGQLSTSQILSGSNQGALSNLGQLSTSQILSGSNQGALSNLGQLSTSQILSGSNQDVSLGQRDPQIPDLGSSPTQSIQVSGNDQLLTAAQSDPISLTQGGQLIETSLGGLDGTRVIPLGSSSVTQVDVSQPIVDNQLYAQVNSGGIDLSVAAGLVQSVIQSLLANASPTCLNEAVLSCRDAGSNVERIRLCGRNWWRENRLRCGDGSLL